MGGGANGALALGGGANGAGRWRQVGRGANGAGRWRQWCWAVAPIGWWRHWGGGAMSSLSIVLTINSVLTVLHPLSWVAHQEYLAIHHILSNLVANGSCRHPIGATPSAHWRHRPAPAIGATPSAHWRHRPAPLAPPPSAIGATAQRHWRHRPAPIGHQGALWRRSVVLPRGRARSSIRSC